MGVLVLLLNYLLWVHAIGWTSPQIRLFYRKIKYSTPRQVKKEAETKNSIEFSRRPLAVQQSIDETGFKYFCRDCGISFFKQKNFMQHMNGKSHLKLLQEREIAWVTFVQQCPSWVVEVADGQSPIDVETGWRPADLADFPMRSLKSTSRCLDPSTTISSLSPQLRGRFYRYLKEGFGQHYPELADIFHFIDTTPNRQYLRVKEIFESLEAFRVISSFILTAQQQDRPIDTIFDLACGHGLVGCMLAYRFPNKKVVCVDLERRPAFAAYVRAWEEKGLCYGTEARPLSNIEYREEDLNIVLQHVNRPWSFLWVATCVPVLCASARV
jgi:hypothetical protein